MTIVWHLISPSPTFDSLTNLQLTLLTLTYQSPLSQNLVTVITSTDLRPRYDFYLRCRKRSPNILSFLCCCFSEVTKTVVVERPTSTVTDSLPSGDPTSSPFTPPFRPQDETCSIQTLRIVCRFAPTVLCQPMCSGQVSSPFPIFVVTLSIAIRLHEFRSSDGS